MATQVANERVYNFSPGPAVLPVPVLEQVRDEMMCLPGAGASILEVSHRGSAYIAVQTEAKERLMRLLGLDDNYDLLFLQGGARLQFSMVPANLLRGSRQPAQYVVTGSWGKKAVQEARREGPTETLWDGQEFNYDRVPDLAELPVSDGAPYVHITSNETIQGVQYSTDWDCGPAPLVCDASSDFLCRSYDIDRYGLIYACAQKNAGPAGVTVVVIRKDLLREPDDGLPGYLSYKNHADADSMWNTPPTFAVYTLGLVAKWLEETIGGLDKMFELNRRKAKLLYDVLDSYPEFYIGHARAQDRSLMNVTFRFADDEQQQQFLSTAAEQGLSNLKGHRSVGGIRASIYNAMPLDGVQALANFMTDFAARHA